ncbi:hypothetical protein ACH5RR_040703 [Cinchona calisaya]|uniref:Uncharacterized protein n=1 Tax=Cinchona calisaya TaxID=153742 RepID=A0ABD2XTJ0_9GENT
MRTRSAKRKTSAAEFLASPLPGTAATTPGSPTIKATSESPKEFEFNFNTTKPTSSSYMKMKANNNGKGRAEAAAASSMFMQLTGGGGFSHSPLKTISDLKELASSRLDSIKRQLDRSQSEILKDIEASQSRLQKRLKIQTQACQQVIDEAEREYKKMFDRISETGEAMKASYTELLVEAQSSASRLCKTSIPEIAKSFEKSINSIRHRYGISST